MDTIPAFYGTSAGGTGGGVAPPLNPTAKRVPDGSGNPATGLDVTNGANGIIEQAHADAGGLHKSIDAVKSAFDAQGKADPNAPTSATMTTQGQAAGADIVTKYGNAPTAVDYGSGAEAEAPDFTIELPATFGGDASFDLNPFRSDRLGPLVAWLRKAIAWAVLVGFAALIWKEFADWPRGFSPIRQASGNPVAGGTGAQATGLVAAGLMTTAIVVATTGLMSWTFGDLTLPSRAVSVAANPLQGIPSKALWLLVRVFPVVTLLSAFVSRSSFRFYGATLFATCSAVIRFVVP